MVGGTAWSAPILLSSRAAAQTAVCTEKCLPVGTGQSTTTATVTCGGNGNNRRVGVNIPIVGSILCPCNGENPNLVVDGVIETNWPGSENALVGGSVVVVQLGDVRRPPLEVNILITATCTDRDPADGGCSRTCQTTATIPLGLQDNGNCRGLNTSVTATLSTSCT